MTTKWHVRNKGDEENLRLPNANEALRNQGPAARFKVTTKEWETYAGPSYGYVRALGKRLDSGAFGTVLQARYNGETAKLLREIRAASKLRMFRAEPPAGATICIKMAHDPWKYDDCVREASVHKYLSSAPAVRLPGCSPVRISDYVPTFYFAGLVADARSGDDVYITVMSKASGKYVYGQSIRSADDFATIERAIVSMWLCGFAHADLHNKNFFWDSESKRPTILDFGFTTMFSPALTEKMRTNVAKAIAAGVDHMGVVWDAVGAYGTGAQSFVNRVQYKRDPKTQDLWYNSDPLLLQILFGKLSAAQQGRVADARKRAWGFRESPVPAPLPASPPRAPPPAPTRAPPPAPTRASPRAPRYRRVPATPRRPSSRLLDRQLGGRLPGIEQAMRRQRKQAVNSGDRNAKGRAIMIGPRGGRYVVTQAGRRARPSTGRKAVVNTGDRNAKGRAIMAGPRGGRYVLTEAGKRTKPIGRRP